MAIPLNRPGSPWVAIDPSVVLENRPSSVNSLVRPGTRRISSSENRRDSEGPTEPKAPPEYSMTTTLSTGGGAGLKLIDTVVERPGPTGTPRTRWGRYPSSSAKTSYVPGGTNRKSNCPPAPVSPSRWVPVPTSVRMT